jgi:TfoX/Sxy family transcriptional regulator of competence genes
MAGWAKKHDPEALAVRLRRALSSRSGVTEKRMFGGICFLHRGNMLCGSGGPGFMFRVGKEQDRAALARPGASPMRISGRRFEGFVWVEPQACDARALKRWVAMSEEYVSTLPRKSK